MKYFRIQVIEPSMDILMQEDKTHSEIFDFNDGSHFSNLYCIIL